MEVTILGNNAATPTLERNPSSQVVQQDSFLAMFDCGEGTQVQILRYKIKANKIRHIFISHLHGDHYLGLLGLLASMGLQGRKSSLNIYASPTLEEIIKLNFQVSQTVLPFSIHFHPIHHEKTEILFENERFIVTAFPLKHRIPCSGFCLKEKETTSRNLKKNKVHSKMSVDEILTLKSGQSVFDEKGNVKYDVEEFTYSKATFSYAYCSDTAYNESILPHIQGVDILYHESTFLEADKEKAIKTFHSTAKDAALIAQKAGIKKLLLGHFSSRYRELEIFLEEAKGIFPNTELSQEGETYSV